jgi:hypothetical protein
VAYHSKLDHKCLRIMYVMENNPSLEDKLSMSTCISGESVQPIYDRSCIPHIFHSATSRIPVQFLSQWNLVMVTWFHEMFTQATNS